ncbi:murein hydrolase activator EnvC family protein [Tumebacillus permanentifrigoris]|uniref:Murein DD-endopeptidase MepM/ murein hydrolase activator NlpD n=1 Tax=Tumebacillus permanentifrigoris TaxID=378543 RepID=A0A316DAG3_9BACL|nr:peptidoglycan DD-metalloendopeptidase family protein [Tumebacillus permanentifrigoris]PWK09652.1 murein DD-endopeptidase MepM/ murein hydrolase activator NlpD [Tumebacillus permanentifrigoris]
MKQKRIQKLTTSLLAVLLLMGAIPYNASAADDDLNTAKQQADQLREKKDQVDQQLQSTLADIHKLEAEIQAAMHKSNDLKQQITVTEAKLAEQKERLKGRVKTMYEGGDVSFWSVLLDATNFSDFLDRMSLLTMIVEQDNNIVNEYKATQAQLKQQQVDLTSEQDLRQSKQQDLLKVEADLQSRYHDISQQIAVKDEEIADLEAAGVAAYQSYTDGMQAGTIIPQTGTGTFAWPVPTSHTINSGYGPRSGEFHKGIDIGAPVGTPIVAVGDGTVWQAGTASGFGHWIVILHDNGVMSVYGHMYSNGVYVSAGQRVKQGQVIGATGSDGESSGPHLHFAIANGVSGGRMSYINPMGYLQ